MPKRKYKRKNPNRKPKQHKFGLGFYVIVNDDNLITCIIEVVYVLDEDPIIKLYYNNEKSLLEPFKLSELEENIKIIGSFDSFNKAKKYISINYSDYYFDPLKFI